jgi:uncharacterized integral membrane protein
MTEVRMQSSASTPSQQTPDGEASADGHVDSAAVVAPDESSPNGADAVAPESPRGRSRRHARRNRLYGYALVTVALAAAVIALGASNTAKAKVSWVFGSSHVSLVWMILATAVLGWLLGLCTAAALHRRTRAPH